MNRCACGKRMSKHANVCKTCHQGRQAQLRAEGLAILQKGCCPDCGQALRQNLAITGWWQCAGYGAEGFRAAGSKPCSWQVIIPEERS